MTHERIGAVPVPASEQPADRLESWKDIATYLRRDVSTAQRWEKRERMPVHRHLHDKLGSVYAFRSELDTWWRGRGNRLTGPEIEESAPGPLPEEASAGTGELATTTDRRRVWRSLAVLGVAVLAVSVAVGLFRQVGSPGPAGAGVKSLASDAARSAGHINPEAADLLLRARYLSVRTTNVDNKRAIELLEQAIALDPDFAAAFGELASAYVTRLAYVTPDESRELEQKAFAMAHTASPSIPMRPRDTSPVATCCGPGRIDSRTKAPWNSSGTRWPWTRAQTKHTDGSPACSSTWDSSTRRFNTPRRRWR